MCGIAGVISADRRQIEPAVRAMMRVMVHRGPDDEGYRESPIGESDSSSTTAGFGFRRLSILDLSPAGHQPMVNTATGDCLIFNGEIYNFRSLRASLESKGIAFRSSGDTEVLLWALSTWGEAAIDRLDGIFAFAFYEARSRRILLARDPLGIKPLYISRVRHHCVFASEVRAVLASGLVPDDLDQAGIASCLAYGTPQEPLTVHRWIHSMPAGTCQWIGAEAAIGQRSAAARRYWRFPREVGSFDEPEAVRGIQFRMRASVSDQCVSDVPMAVFLSGGIDSATIAALARDDGRMVHTYSVGYASAHGEDESVQAAATARALGTEHHPLILDDNSVVAQWRHWLMSADRPSVDGFNTYLVSGAVKAAGATVALSGLGADELFGGYHTFNDAKWAQRIQQYFSLIPKPFRSMAAQLAFSRTPLNRRQRAIEMASASHSIVDMVALLRSTATGSDLAAMGLTWHRLGLTPNYLPPEAYEPFSDSGPDLFRSVSQADLFLYMNNTLLRDADANGMAHSLEIRVPFLARALVDYVGAMPGNMKMPSGRHPKHLLREAGKAILAPEVFDRPKRGFVLPIGTWMYDTLRDECEAAIDALSESGILDKSAMRSLWTRYKAQWEHLHYSYPLALVALGSYLGMLNSRRPERYRLEGNWPPCATIPETALTGRCS